MTTRTTLLASCRMLGIEPWAYLRDLFCLLPNWPAHRVLQLSPFHWKTTAENPQTQTLLELDPYRRLTLDRG